MNGDLNPTNDRNEVMSDERQVEAAIFVYSSKFVAHGLKIHEILDLSCRSSSSGMKQSEQPDESAIKFLRRGRGRPKTA